MLANSFEQISFSKNRSIEFSHLQINKCFLKLVKYLLFFKWKQILNDLSRIMYISSKVDCMVKVAFQFCCFQYMTRQRKVERVTVSFASIMFYKGAGGNVLASIFDCFFEIVNLVNNIACTYHRSVVRCEVYVWRCSTFFCPVIYRNQYGVWKAAVVTMLLSTILENIIIYLQIYCYFCKYNAIFANIILYFCKYNAIFFQK